MLPSSFTTEDAFSNRYGENLSTSSHDCKAFMFYKEAGFARSYEVADDYFSLVGWGIVNGAHGDESRQDYCCREFSELFLQGALLLTVSSDDQNATPFISLNNVFESMSLSLAFCRRWSVE